MSRITDKFNTLKAKGKKALITFISAGDPDIEVSYNLVLEMERQGADIIELGVPFSDPIADGPVIQKASQRALKHSINYPKIFDLVRRIREKTEVPLILMTYYNTIFKYGERRLVMDSIAAGVDGIIVPDLPPEEAGSFIEAAYGSTLDIIFLLAPTSTPDRIALISKKSQGFIYYVSMTGITGADGVVAGEVEKKIAEIKKATDKPVAVGFGISNAQQAGQIAKWAEGVIVGSAIIKVIEEHLSDQEKMVKAVGKFVSRLRGAIDNA